MNGTGWEFPQDKKDYGFLTIDFIRPQSLWDKPLSLSHQNHPKGAEFAKRQFGYVVALDKIINTAGYSDLCFRPLYPALEAELYIVWKKYRMHSRASSAFLNQLQEEVEP